MEGTAALVSSSPFWCQHLVSFLPSTENQSPELYNTEQAHTRIMASIIELISNLVYTVNTTRLFELSAASMIVYDHFITLDQEVEYIWKRRWSWIKTLFLWIRYFGGGIVLLIAGTFTSKLITNEYCYVFFWFQGMSSLVVRFALQAVLQIRLYALYFHSKPVAILLGLFFLGEIAACFDILITAALQMQATSHPLFDFVTVCIPLDVSPAHYFQFWLPMITYEAILGAFALWIGVRHMRELKKWDFNGLVNILVKDSVLYFLVVLCTDLVDLAVWLRALDWVETPLGYCGSLAVIVGCRLTMNMHQVQSEPFAPKSEEHTLSDFHAAPRQLHRRNDTSSTPDFNDSNLSVLDIS